MKSTGRCIFFIGMLFWLCPLSLCQLTSQTLTLSREEAIDLALRRNPGVLAASKQIEAARGRSLQEWWPANPEIAVEYEGVPEGKGLRDYEERFIRFSQSLDFPTNILLKKRIADKEVEITRMEYERVKLDLIHKVKIAYLLLVAQSGQLDLARQNLQLTEDFLEKARIRYEVGEGTQLEYLKAKVERARAQNNLASTRSEYDIARAELNLLLAREFGSDISPTDSLAFAPLSHTVSELKDIAFRVHPELRLMDLKVEAAQSSRTLAWNSFLPEIQASYFNQNIGGNSDFWGLELGFSVPLWIPFRQRGAINEWNAQVAATRFEGETVRKELALRIESAFLRVKAAEKQVHLFTEELLPEAEEVYRIARRSYEQGVSGYLELLEAQRTLAEANSGHLDSLFDYGLAVATLERAMGVRSVFSQEKGERE